VAFLLFAVVAAVTPGPSNVMLTATGAQVGVVRGLPCLLGVATGMGAMMFVVPLGLGTLVLDRPLVIKALHWGGAAVLLWLSWRIATSRRRIDSAQTGASAGYLGATIFQCVNPKSWLVTTSAGGTFLSPEAGSAVVQAAAFAGLFVLAALPSGCLWLAFGAAVQRVLHGGRRRRVFNIAMGTLLALSIVLIVR
jgi:threonine/homoserine/homoserine lactone efflux protein